MGAACSSPPLADPVRLPTRAHRIWIMALCAAGLALMAAALPYKPAGMDDFLPFYRSTRLLGSPDLFAQSAYNAQGLMFLRTPLYAWLLQPLGAMSYPHARLFWMLLMALALAIAVWLWPGRRVRIAMALCWGLPTFFAFALGQDIGLVLVLMSVVARLWSKGREFPAGLVASLFALKATFLPPVALVFLARSRRGFYALLIGLAVHFVLCLAIQGPGWIPEYLAAIRSPFLDQAGARMPSIRAFTSGVPLAVFSAAIYIWLWRAARSGSPIDALAAAFPLSLAASPHCYIYDLVLAVPLLANAASPKTLRGLLAAIALSPAPAILMSMANPLGGAIAVAAILLATAPLAWRGQNLDLA